MCDQESGLLGGQGDHGPHTLPSSDQPFLGDAVSRLAWSLPIAETDRMRAAHSAHTILGYDGNRPIPVRLQRFAGHDVSTD